MTLSRILLFVGFFGIPGLLIVAGVISIVNHNFTKKWLVIDGRVTFAEVKGGGDGWDCRVEYAYSVDGREYQGRKILRNHIQEGTLEEARKHPDAYQTGQTIKVHYNPANPAGHFVYQESILGAAGMIGFGILVLIGVFIAMKAGMPIPQ
jgi:hypothetical protein